MTRIVSILSVIILSIWLLGIKPAEPELRWCKEPNHSSYWRSPFPDEYQSLIRQYYFDAMVTGCLDGKRHNADEGWAFARQF